MATGLKPKKKKEKTLKGKINKLNDIEFKEILRNHIQGVSKYRTADGIGIRYRFQAENLFYNLITLLPYIKGRNLLIINV